MAVIKTLTRTFKANNTQLDAEFKEQLQKSLSEADLYFQQYTEYATLWFNTQTTITVQYDGVKWNQLVFNPQNKISEVRSRVNFRKFIISVVENTEYKPAFTAKQRVQNACRKAMYETDTYKDMVAKRPSGMDIDHCGEYEFNDIYERFIQRVDEVSKTGEGWPKRGNNTVEEYIMHQALVTDDRLGGMKFSPCIGQDLMHFFNHLHDEMAELQYLTKQEHKVKTKQRR